MCKSDCEEFKDLSVGDHGRQNGYQKQNGKEIKPGHNPHNENDAYDKFQGP